MTFNEQFTYLFNKISLCCKIRLVKRMIQMSVETPKTKKKSVKQFKKW